MIRRSFRGKVVAITGAAGGLGKALAHRFGREGASIAALDRTEADLVELAADLSGAGIAVRTFVCDVTDEAACRQAIHGAEEAFGRIDVLINNAGITHRSSFAGTSADVVKRVVEVNLFGTIHCTHAALPALLKTGGQVIGISSVAGIAPLPARTGYAASKHALHGFLGSLRTEVADKGVGVMLVCPTFIATGIERNALGPDGRPAGKPQVRMGKQATADEVADSIVTAAMRNESLVFTSALGRVSFWLNAIAPRLYERIVARKFRQEL